MTVADTNIPVHATTLTSPQRGGALAALERVQAGGLAITRQILREFIAATTRPQAWADAVPVASALQIAERLSRRFAVLEDGPAVWAELQRLGGSFEFGGKQVHDANIVATMLAFGERRLLTYNVAHFRRFSSAIEIIEP